MTGAEMPADAKHAVRFAWACSDCRRSGFVEIEFPISPRSLWAAIAEADNRSHPYTMCPQHYLHFSPVGLGQGEKSPDSKPRHSPSDPDQRPALPLKDRPICFRISSEMYHDTFEAIGEASMCWNPRPSDEVFASEQASDVAVRLCFKIANEVESKTARLQEAFDAAKAYIDANVCDPDTTAEMWKAYEAYQAACASLAGRAAGARSW